MNLAEAAEIVEAAVFQVQRAGFRVEATVDEKLVVKTAAYAAPQQELEIELEYDSGRKSKS